jgi:hypothetical protein
MSTIKNVKFSYLYQDYGNFKRFGSIIMSNRSGGGLKTLKAELILRLTDSVFLIRNMLVFLICTLKITPMIPNWIMIGMSSAKSRSQVNRSPIRIAGIYTTFLMRLGHRFAP